METLLNPLDQTYENVVQIGGGGGGIIYKAYHNRLRKEVVIKKIRDSVRGVVDDRAEADIIKNLKHSFLPQIYDHFTTPDGGVYTVMDFIEGQSLAQLLEIYGMFPQKRVLKWARQLCEALEYLHSHNIIHSDVKPANIMVTPEDNICLIDFNISLVAGAEGAVVRGLSRGYAAPEQYIGLNEDTHATVNQDESDDKTLLDSGGTLLETQATALNVGEGRNAGGFSSRAASGWLSEVNPRTDIYGLGATLYHLLTGQRPGTPWESVRPLASFPTRLSDATIQIIEKAMEPEPKKRFSGTSEMRRALVGIGKLDGRYRKHAALCMGVTVAFCAAAAVLAVMTCMGCIRMGEEKTQQYYALISQGEQLLEEGSQEQARVLFSQAALAQPGRIEAYTYMAALIYHQGSYEECIAFISELAANRRFDAAEENARYLGELYYILASCYLEQGSYMLAAEQFTQALAYDEANTAYSRDYAIALAKGGDIDGARQILEQLRQSGGTGASVTMVAGELLYAAGDYGQAAGQFAQAAQEAIGAGDYQLAARIYLVWADCCRSLDGDALGEEIIVLERALEVLPLSGNLVHTERLGDAYARQAGVAGEDGAAWYEKALDCFESLYDRGYARFSVMQNIAVIRQYLGRYALSEEMLLTMAAQYPEDYRVYMRLCYLYADWQGARAVQDRDYSEMERCYELAEQFYRRNSNEDAEMLMLSAVMDEIHAAGW